MSYRKITPSPSAYNYPLLIKNLLKTPMTYSIDKEIGYRDQMRYTYGTLQKRIAKLANSLTNLGVKAGDTIAVMDWDSHRYLECFFAIPMIGAVLHTVNIRLSSEQLLYTINHAEDDVILVFSDFLPMLEAIKDKIKSVKKIIMLKDSDEISHASLQIDSEYETMLNKANDHYDFPDFDENTMATTFYTTGTTGLPKGVCFSHRQIVLHTYAQISSISAFRSQSKIDSEDVYMPLTPMFHVHAWGLPYTMTLLGAKQIYPGRYEPEMLLKLITTEKVTFSHCVPTIMHMLVNSPVIDKLDLSNWKVIIGGSALSKELCKIALKYKINIYSAYGMSETCPMLTIANLKPSMLNWGIEKQVEIRCKTGLPIPNVDLEIVDPLGNPMPHDGKATGEVVVRAPWLTQGYLKDPEKSEKLWQGGWLHTGDIGFIDSEGYLKITDRIKDVIKTGGEWISSLELEDILLSNVAVSEAAVVAVEDNKWGERPLAIVVLKPEYKNKLSNDDLKLSFNPYVEKGLLPKYGVPDKIIFAESLPKTSVGKMNKKVLRSQYCQ